MVSMIPPFTHYDPDDPNCAALELPSESKDTSPSRSLNGRVHRKRKRASEQSDKEDACSSPQPPAYNVAHTLDINQPVDTAHSDSNGFKFDFEDEDGPEEQEFVVEDEPDEKMVLKAQTTPSQLPSAEQEGSLFLPDDIEAGFRWVDSRCNDPEQVRRVLTAK